MSGERDWSAIVGVKDAQVRAFATRTLRGRWMMTPKPRGRRRGEASNTSAPDSSRLGAEQVLNDPKERAVRRAWIR